MAKKAIVELRNINKDSARYSKYVNDVLATVDSPDIRILGIFIVGE